MSFYIDNSDVSKSRGLIALALPAIYAGAVGGVYNYILETDPSYMNVSSVARYSALCGAAQFLASQATAMVLPEFSNPKLRQLENIGVGAATTAALNAIFQQMAGGNGGKGDYRMRHNLIGGALAGGATPLVSNLISRA